MDKIEPIKYAFDDLNGQAQLDITCAVQAHRRSLALPMEIGYPCVYWTGFDIEHGGRCINIEFYVPETGTTQVYHYHKTGVGLYDWEWWQ